MLARLGNENFMEVSFYYFKNKPIHQERNINFWARYTLLISSFSCIIRYLLFLASLGFKHNLSASQKKKSVASTDMPATIGFISGEDYLQLMIADTARIGIADIFGSTTYQSLYCGRTN